MPSAGLEPAIPAIKWPQTYDSDRTATGIGQPSFTMLNVNQKVKCVVIFFENILSYFVVIRMEALELFTPGKTKDVTRRFLGMFARQPRKRLLAVIMSCHVMSCHVMSACQQCISWFPLDICEILCFVSDGQIYTRLTRDKKQTLYTTTLVYHSRCEPKQKKHWTI